MTLCITARIHALGVGRDRDAVMYSNVAEKNLKVFLTTIKGFEDWYLTILYVFCFDSINSRCVNYVKVIYMVLLSQY